MTVSEWLTRSENLLRHAGIESARLDSLVLLSDELQKDKSWLLAYSDYELQGSELKNLSTKVAQRVQHAPLAYIRGKVEFYGKTFMVGPDVLVPRPESETFLELLCGLESASYLSIIDVGTGSGALAISAALLCPTRNVYATDISESALKVASRNAKFHNVAVRFTHGNLLDSITDDVLSGSLLLCNLPYVPTSFTINKAATYEPTLAIFSGDDGLDHYRALFLQLRDRHTQPAFILTESLLPQHDKVKKLALDNGYILRKTNGLVQLCANTNKSEHSPTAAARLLG